MFFPNRTALTAIILATSLTAAHAQPQGQETQGQGSETPMMGEGNTGEMMPMMPVMPMMPMMMVPMMGGMMGMPPQGGMQPQTGMMPQGSGEGMPMMGCMGRMMPMMGEMMGHGEAASPMGMMMFDHIEGHIAFLKAELGITTAQEQQWNAFADTLRANAKTMQEQRRAMMEKGMPTTWPDRIMLHERMLEARLRAVKAIEGPAKALYEALSPEQQKKADELMGHPMRGM